MADDTFADGGSWTTQEILLWVLLGVLVAVALTVVVLTVISSVRRYRAMRAAGLDPYTADIQVLAKLAKGQQVTAAPQPHVSTEERLEEAERLRARGLISDQEYAAMRRAALGIGS